LFCQVLKYVDQMSDRWYWLGFSIDSLLLYADACEMEIMTKLLIWKLLSQNCQQCILGNYCIFNLHHFSSHSQTWLSWFLTSLYSVLDGIQASCDPIVRGRR
jgi:hypothetical protein